MGSEVVSRLIIKRSGNENQLTVLMARPSEEESNCPAVHPHPSLDTGTELTYLICELIPSRASSSGANAPGGIPADRSFWTPACRARKKLAIVRVSGCWCWMFGARGKLGWLVLTCRVEVGCRERHRDPPAAARVRYPQRGLALCRHQQTVTDVCVHPNWQVERDGTMQKTTKREVKKRERDISGGLKGPRT